MVIEDHIFDKKEKIVFSIEPLMELYPLLPFDMRIGEI